MTAVYIFKKKRNRKTEIVLEKYLIMVMVKIFMIIVK